jgi:hypothetical protein
MDGCVIQDFWIVYPSGTRTDREVYTDRGKTWRLVAEHHIKRRSAAQPALGLQLPPSG